MDEAGMKTLCGEKIKDFFMGHECKIIYDGV